MLLQWAPDGQVSLPAPFEWQPKMHSAPPSSERSHTRPSTHSESRLQLPLAVCDPEATSFRQAPRPPPRTLQWVAIAHVSALPSCAAWHPTTHSAPPVRP